MRAYKIKVFLKDTELLIWRRIIIPSEITFKRLHDIIQFSMGWRDSYLYDFNIIEEKLRVTGDEEAIAEYESYFKKKLTKKNDPYGYVAKMLEITPKLSSYMKIDKYLINYKNIEYVYDFGDYWKHSIILEEVLENYENNYPVCIEGEGACPPEDIGGIFEYEQFLKAINDKSHPKHEELKEWADKQYYKYIFDIESINKQIKDILYKALG